MNEKTELTGYRILGTMLILAMVFGMYRLGHPPTDTTKTQEDNHTVTTIVTTKEPNGTTKTIETIDSKTKTKTVVQAPQAKKLNVSVLVANDFSQSTPKLLYGVSVTKEVLGPITIGLFGLTNGTVGGSIGINF